MTNVSTIGAAVGRVHVACSHQSVLLRHLVKLSVLVVSCCLFPSVSAIEASQICGHVRSTCLVGGIVLRTTGSSQCSLTCVGVRCVTFTSVGIELAVRALTQLVVSLVPAPTRSTIVISSPSVCHAGNRSWSGLLKFISEVL